MVYTLVQINCQDFDKWWSIFQSSIDLRRSFGSLGVQVYRNPSEPCSAVILGEYSDLEKAKQLFQSQEYRQAIQQAGVVGIPDIKFLEKVGQLAA